MTRRVQFARSAVTGNIPPQLQPGTPAFNWADGKAYVGTAGGSAQLISQMILDHDAALVYRAGDFVVYENDLYRAKVDVPANVGFRPEEWTRMTNLGTADSGLRSASGVISGGAVSGQSSSGLTVAAGSGLAVNRRDPANIIVTFVEWGAFSVAAPYPGGAIGFSLYLNESGIAQVVSGNDGVLRREGIRLAQGLWSDVGGEVWSVWDARIWAGRSPDESTDLIAEVLYPAIADGLRVAGNADLTIAHMEGSVFSVGIGPSSDPARLAVAAQDPASFSPITRLGNNLQGAVTDVPLSWDTGVGSSPLSAGQFTTHVLKMNLSGELYLELGQKTYAGVTEAINDVSIYVREEMSHSLPESAAATLAAIIVSAETTDLTDLATGRVVPAIYPGQEFNQASETDSSAFYLLDGSRSLTGDMNAGGNTISNATLDGNILKTKDGDTTGVNPVLEEREIATHTLDNKVLSGLDTVADRIEMHDPARSYLTGDACYEGNVLYRADAPVPPKAFDPADWTAIGSAAGDLTGAVILEPQTAGRNEVDLTGFPSVEGLIVTPDPSQTAVVADLGGSVVDRYGMPGGNFGYIVRQVAQATHGFTAIGEAVAFDNPNWVPADASDPDISGKALGVVKEVINANNFVLQLGGTVENLSTAAFEGGSITPGVAYYVSPTTAGKLTSTAPSSPNRVDPVLITTTATEGVLALTTAGDVELGGGGQTFFTVNQPAHGFTVLGAPIYSNAGTWELAQGNEVATMGVGLIQEITDANNFIVNVSGLIESLDPAAFVGAVAPTAGKFYYVSQDTAGVMTEIAPIEREGLNRVLLALSATTGVVLQDRGDWIPLTQRGGLVKHSPLDFQQSAASEIFLTFQSEGVVPTWGLLQGVSGGLNLTSPEGPVNYAFTADAAIPASNADVVLRRGWADDLYLSVDGGAITGDIVMTGNLGLTGNLAVEGFFDVIGDATVSGTLALGDTLGISGPQDSILFENPTAANPDPHTLQAGDDGNIRFGHGADNIIAGIIEPAGPALSSPQTILTREKADGLYDPSGAAGKYASARTRVDGTMDVQTGFASCTRTTTGVYEYIFATERFDIDYHVSPTRIQTAGDNRVWVGVQEQRGDGFKIYFRLMTDTAQNTDHTVIVWEIF